VIAVSDLVDEETIWSTEVPASLYESSGEDEYLPDESGFEVATLTDELGDETGHSEQVCGTFSEIGALDEYRPDTQWGISAADESAEQFEPLAETAAEYDNQAGHFQSGWQPTADENAGLDEYPQEWQQVSDEATTPSAAFDEHADPALLAAVMRLGTEDEASPAYDEDLQSGVEQFGGSEHKDLGDKAAGPVATVITYGSPPQALSFGDVVALAGDYFGSYSELADLNRTAKGRDEIAWARWHCLGLKASGVPEPPAIKEQKKAVLDRYYALAAANVSHFSWGGSAYSAYTQGHAGALVDALQAGMSNDERLWRQALTKEAFGDHFLTDSFSAGHVRTPRADIRQWYAEHMPTSGDALTRRMARFLFDLLNERQQLPPIAWWYSWILRLRGIELLQDDIRKTGGEAAKTFSLGEIVSLALHNHDNKGLDVVSNVDADGRAVPGGYHWRAVGDNHLGIKRDAKPHARDSRCAAPVFSPASALTSRMATAAVIASLRELEKVRGVGRSVAQQRPSATDRARIIQNTVGPSFAARNYIPREDPASHGNAALKSANNQQAPLDWRWGQLGEVAYRAVDEAVRCSVASELAELIASVDDPVVVTRAGMTFRVHGTRTAFAQFVSHLRNNGIKAIEDSVGIRAR
jgi:hypothetical protein